MVNEQTNDSQQKVYSEMVKIAATVIGRPILLAV
jgi:hypothetical protein